MCVGELRKVVTWLHKNSGGVAYMVHLKAIEGKAQLQKHGREGEDPSVVKLPLAAKETESCDSSDGSACAGVQVKLAEEDGVGNDEL